MMRVSRTEFAGIRRGKVSGIPTIGGVSHERTAQASQQKCLETRFNDVNGTSRTLGPIGKV